VGSLKGALGRLLRVSLFSGQGETEKYFKTGKK
jgi:hypothetical protein